MSQPTNIVMLRSIILSPDNKYYYMTMFRLSEEIECSVCLADVCYSFFNPTISKNNIEASDV